MGEFSVGLRCPADPTDIQCPRAEQQDSCMRSTQLSPSPLGSAGAPPTAVSKHCPGARGERANVQLELPRDGVGEGGWGGGDLHIH